MLSSNDTSRLFSIEAIIGHVAIAVTQLDQDCGIGAQYTLYRWPMSPR